MSVAVLAGALGQWPFGRLSDRMDRRKVILGAACWAALAGLLFVLRSHSSFTGLLAVVFLFGLYTLPVYSITVAHINPSSQHARHVEFQKGLVLSSGMAVVAGCTIRT